MSAGDQNATELGGKLSPDCHTAMAHFYRGEMNRLTVWHVRLDTTTNWAILLTTGMTTFPCVVTEVNFEDASQTLRINYVMRTPEDTTLKQPFLLKEETLLFDQAQGYLDLSACGINQVTITASTGP